MSAWTSGYTLECTPESRGNLRGHLKSGHAWSVQNRPCTKAVRDEIVLLCRLLRKQVCFCAPASGTALEYVSVVKQAVKHGSDGRTVSQQLAPVFHGAVGGQKGAGTFIASHR